MKMPQVTITEENGQPPGWISSSAGQTPDGNQFGFIITEFGVVFNLEDKSKRVWSTEQQKIITPETVEQYSYPLTAEEAIALLNSIGGEFCCSNCTASLLARLCDVPKEELDSETWEPSLKIDEIIERLKSYLDRNAYHFA